jgi:hypothetical protein
MPSHYIAPVRVPLPRTPRRRHAAAALAGLRHWLLRAVPRREFATVVLRLRGN